MTYGVRRVTNDRAVSGMRASAPARIVSLMMGVWFLSSFFGNFLSGYLGTFWEQMPKENFFLLMFALSFATGLAFFALLKPLKKAIGHGEQSSADV